MNTSVPDGRSIALYVLTVIGLVLFIIVMIFTIVMWVQRQKKPSKQKQEIIEI